MTIRTLLETLKMTYAHIVVRTKENGFLEYLGGGMSDIVISRFGDLVVEYADICDNVFIIYATRRNCDV